MKWNIDKILLEDFIQWCVEGGFPGTEEEMEDIMFQYSAMIDSHEFRKYTDSLVKMVSSTTKFNMVECLVSILQVRYIKEYVDELKLLGYPGEYNPKKEDRYKKELSNAYKNAKSLLVQAQQKKKELEEMNKSSTKESVTRKNFDESIVTLSKFLGYQIKESDITVQKYCLMIKRCNEYAESNRRDSRSNGFKSA